MVVLVKWSFNLLVNDGKPLTLGDSIEGITAYDKLSVNIAGKDDQGDATEKTVDLQPSDVSNVALLCIKSDNYPSAKNPGELSYTLTEADNTPKVDLLGPHVLVGNALVALLGDNLTKLKFKNSLSAPANIDIVVGRIA